MSVQRWTKEQEQFLRDKWEVWTPEEIGKPMGRSADAVVQRAYHLGLEGRDKNPSNRPKSELTNKRPSTDGSAE